MKLTLPPPSKKKKEIVHSTPEYKKNDIKFEKFYKFVNYKHFIMLSISYAFKIIGPYVYGIHWCNSCIYFGTCTFYSSISKIYILSLISIIACMLNGYGPVIKVFTKIF